MQKTRRGIGKRDRRESPFPEYGTVFEHLFSKVSKRTLIVYPTADTAITATIRRACPSRPAAWPAAKTHHRIAAARGNPLCTADLPHQAFSLSLYIQMIAEDQAHWRALDREMKTLIQEIEACQPIQTIPRIGRTQVATIIAEIGEIVGWFENARKRVAFAGVDPRVHQSGRLKASVN